MNNSQSLLPRLLLATATFGTAALLALAVINTVNSYRTGTDLTQDGKAASQGQASFQLPTNSANLKQIPNWHLFGHKAQQTSKKAIPKEIIEAPTTPLALTLQGTFLGKSKTEGSWAIISSADDKQAMYQVGDEVSAGVVLFAVEPFRVILERNGRHESLSLSRPSISEALQSSMANESQPLSENNSANPSPNAASPSTKKIRNRHTEKQALIEEMARIRRKFAK